MERVILLIKTGVEKKDGKRTRMADGFGSLPPIVGLMEASHNMPLAQELSASMDVPQSNLW
jgi:hypothetical protein